jgi:Icc-related predicted phosphoesterase
MKVAALSDLHGYLPEIESCEVVFICGDFSPRDIEEDIEAMKEWILEEFLPWANNIECEKVFFIAGNHDFIARQDFMYEVFNDKVVYLCNDSTQYVSKEGKIYSIFGTPYCKQYGDWAFMQDPIGLRFHYGDIPYKVDILMTHDQPWGIGDVTLQNVSWKGEHIGNIILSEAILEKEPRLLFCGHLHSTDHNPLKIGNTIRYNVSIVDENYMKVYDITYVEI